MMKLAMKKDVREAITTVGETLRKIGIDPSDKVCYSYLESCQ
jgi:hypothetical protein